MKFLFKKTYFSTGKKCNMIFNSAQVIKKSQFEVIEIDDWDVFCDGFHFFSKAKDAILSISKTHR